MISVCRACLNPEALWRDLFCTLRAVTEKTTSRRASRKLLATVLEIAITILVKDEAAGKALVDGGGLKQEKLNEQLALQVRCSQISAYILPSALPCAHALVQRQHVHC